MWRLPEKNDETSVIDFAKKLNCVSIKKIPTLVCSSYYKENDCHNNVLSYIDIHGGNRLCGYYFLVSDLDIQAIYHSVWQSPSGQIYDITPFPDNRKVNIVGLLGSSEFLDLNVYYSCLAKYKEQEVDIMYYVYGLINPADSQPFYIGKGSGNRAQTHLRKIPDTRNVYKENKIASIRKNGLEPEIHVYADNILDEDLAYDMEEELILKYGRKGYEPYGILTNVCLGSRPPNHKGKSYEDIYGPERAAEQRKLRSRIQKQRGGYGPKQHSPETIEKLKIVNAGEKNGMWGKHHTAESKAKISAKAKLRTGKNNKHSKVYKLVDPTGKEYVLYGGELECFCKNNNLSHGTFRKVLHLNWAQSKKGKNKGWAISYLDDLDL